MGSNDKWVNVNNTTNITYRQLFDDAIALWNSLNIKGDGTPLFQVDDNILQLRTIKAIAYEGSTARCYTTLFGNIELSTTGFADSNIDRQKAVDIIAHEMGHALGLGDLYIDARLNYISLFVLLTTRIS